MSAVLQQMADGYEHRELCDEMGYQHNRNRVVLLQVRGSFSK